MATILDKYENNTNEIAVPVGESAGKAEQRYALSRKERKIFKALAKALRKHNKLLKQEAERRRAEEEAVETTARSKHDNGVRGFLVKFGDAVCKAVPKVLTTLVTLALGYFFKTKFAGKAPQVA